MSSRARKKVEDWFALDEDASEAIASIERAGSGDAASADPAEGDQLPRKSLFAASIASRLAAKARISRCKAAERKRVVAHRWSLVNASSAVGGAFNVRSKRLDAERHAVLNLAASRGLLLERDRFGGGSPLAGKEAAELDEDVVPIWSQGNVELYSREKLCARRITRQDDRLIPHVELWWQLACSHELTETGDLIESGRITFDEYVAINMRFYKLLIEPYDEAEARASAEEDWRHDVEQSGVMDFPTFFASMTEMADQWTNTTDVDEYVQFLHYLWEELTVEDEETGDVHWIGWKPAAKAKRPRRKPKAKKRTKPIDLSRLYARPSGVPAKPPPKKPTVPVGPKRRVIAKALPPEIPALPVALMRSELVDGGLQVLTRKSRLPPADPPAVARVVIGIEIGRADEEACSPICITGENVGGADAIHLFDERIAVGSRELRVVNATTLTLVLPQALVEQHADRPFQGVSIVAGGSVTEQDPRETVAPTIIYRPVISDVRLVGDVLGNAVIHGDWFQQDELVVSVGGLPLDSASVFLVDECTIACDVPSSLCNDGRPVRVVVAVCGIPSRSVLCRLAVADRLPQQAASQSAPKQARLPAVSRAADEPEWHPLPAFMPIETYRQQPVRVERPISPSRAPNDLRRAIRPERRAALDVRRPASAVHRRRGVLRSTWSYNTEAVPTFRREHFKTARERRIVSSEAHVHVPGDETRSRAAHTHATRTHATQILDFDASLASSFP